LTDLLWIEDDPALRRIYRPLLEASGYRVREAATADEARSAIAARPPGLVLLDLMLPPSGRVAEGLSLIDHMIGADRPPRIIVLSGAGGHDSALEAIRRGAHDFLAKPVDPDVLDVVLARAARRLELEDELAALRAALRQRTPDGGMLGRSAAFLASVELVDKVAPTDLPVAISGEPGTGKELAARRVHTASRRAEGPFVAVNCGALPPNLLESTLFGHTRGAFTGAGRARRGLFAEADGGTLFLDEVGELEPPTQVRLLRALETGEIRPVGADRSVRVDVRTVCATNRDLATLVAEGAFRDDLYWRLRGVEVHLPPLRDRGDDVLVLALHFLRSAAGLVGRAPRLTPAAEVALSAHAWPGNLRELRHAMRRAAVLAADRGHILPDDLGLRSAPGGAPGRAPDGGTLAEQVTALERRVIRAALSAEGGNRTRAARRLGLSRQGLLNKMGRYGLGG